MILKMTDSCTKMPDTMDTAYANECINRITTTVEAMHAFYISLNNSMLTSVADYDKLHAMHGTCRQLIRAYYTYLTETNVPAKDSYITYWLNTDRVSDIFDDVESFLEL